MLTTVVALIVVLGVLVFIHEAGHFVAAKWAGIYVHRFSLGLGSPIPWLTFRKGETEYSVSWIPLGGYVKMASGEEDIGGSPLEGGQAATQVPPDRLFEAKPLWKRMIVILAGVTMNALFAWLIFSFLAAKNGRQIDPGTTVGRIDAEATSEVGQELAGIKPGSRIVTINERPVSSWNEVQDAILNSAGPELRVLFADGSADTLPIHQDALAARARAAQALLPYRPAVIGQLVPGQPAEKAGLLPGDTIVAVDGVPIGQWYDILDQFRGRARPEVSMEVARGATRTNLYRSARGRHAR